MPSNCPPGVATQHALDMRVDRFLPLLKSTFTSLIAPVSLLLIAAKSLSRVSDGLLFTMLPIFTVQELDWADVRYNDWYATGGIVAAIVGLIVSPFIDKFGTQFALVAITIVKVSAILLVGLSALIDYDDAIIGLVIISLVCSQLFTITLIATMMHICTPKVAATQFAVYMALSNLMFAGGSLVYAGLQAYLGATGLLVCTVMIMLSLLPAWWWVNRRYLQPTDTQNQTLDPA